MICLVKIRRSDFEFGKIVIRFTSALEIELPHLILKASKISTRTFLGNFTYPNPKLQEMKTNSTIRENLPLFFPYTCTVNDLILGQNRVASFDQLKPGTSNELTKLKITQPTISSVISKQSAISLTNNEIYN